MSLGNRHHNTLSSQALGRRARSRVATTHIPIVGVGGGVGLFHLGDGDLAILRLPALGGLLDLPGLALRGGVLYLYVDVGHGAWVLCEDTISPDAVATRIRMASNGGRIAGIIPECLAHGTVGGVWDLNLEE